MSEREILELRYTVKSNGEVIDNKTKKTVKFSDNGQGYLVARLHTSLSKNKDGRKPYKQHRLVAMFYLDTYKPELHVNHKDGVKTNNDVSNLEMVTFKENARHAWDVLKRGDRMPRDEKGMFISHKNN